MQSILVDNAKVMAKGQIPLHSSVTTLFTLSSIFPGVTNEYRVEYRVVSQNISSAIFESSFMQV